MDFEGSIVNSVPRLTLSTIGEFRVGNSRTFTLLTIEGAKVQKMALSAIFGDGPSAEIASG